jgi:DNA-binding NarL/FixJ family response regulator
MDKRDKPRILFVDDEPNVLAALRRALRDCGAGWELVFHVSAREAIADHEQRPFDVVVADMAMPEMSGIELIKTVARSRPSIVPIVLTGSGDLQTAVAAINEANVFRFYTKPCSGAVLADGIGEALAHGDDGAKAVEASPDGAIGVALLHRLPIGVLVVDRTSRVLFLNRRGAEYVAAGDALRVGRGEVCRAAWPAETTELHNLVTAVVDGGETAAVRALSLSRTTGDRPLSVVISRLGVAVQSEPVAVLLVSDPARQAVPSVEIVARLFDLTDTEARLALALAEGQRIEEAAVALGITVNSARTYLKHVFGKTGVARQAELVRLVLAAPTLLDLRGIGRSASGKEEPATPAKVGA